MKAQEQTLIGFLQAKQQFVIPIYQRKYSWKKAQCEKLWEDIKNLSSNKNIERHFVGSIVRIKKNLDSAEISQQTIIDGQQRITTIILLIAAIIQKVESEDRKEDLITTYLINKYGKEELKYKLILTKEDKESLKNIIDNITNSKLESTAIKTNFEFFKEKMKNEDFENILGGISKLIIVDVSLDQALDNPQLIFESLNSTGLGLSQADLIRNYILMGLDHKKQEEIYNKYWSVMEKDFGEYYTKEFDVFVRDYLTLKSESNQIPNIKNVYETFKQYFIKNGGISNIESIMDNIFKYSQYYVKIKLGQEENKKFKKAFADLKTLNISVVIPFLLEVYNDYENSIIDEEEFLEILSIIQSYVVRRSVCGLVTNSLNKTFATLYKKIDKGDYINSLKIAFAFMKSYKRFPDNDEFKSEIIKNDIYHTNNCGFLLSSIENYNRKEIVNFMGDDYTIEHILPQNSTLSEEWKEMLGPDWEVVHDKYLHTLGNLTLTRYNSEYSDKPFSQKKTMTGGFDSSPLNLNESVRGYNVWNKSSIIERAENLFETIVKIWGNITISKEILEKYKVKTEPKITYTIDDHPYLSDGEMSELFETLRRRIKNINTSVSESFTKLYIAYKVDNNFVCIIPAKSQLKLYLNLDIVDISDPKGLCSDVTDKGHWGTGNTEVVLSSTEQLDDAMELIKQSFENNSTED
ncbi:MAG: DUF262 domain-containing protein [Alphaproteobacteria bacterium]|nr:DUF262 domain-containing protein [Alphaproteobacteria bacterium]